MEYKRKFKRVNGDVKPRLLSKTNQIEGGCWEWTGALTIHGYGVMGVNGKTVLSHRVSHRIFSGEIPKGLYVCHKCDNPKCINPDHLFLGTAKDNSEDMIRKGRHVTRWNAVRVKKAPIKKRARNTKEICIRGHVRTSENTKIDKIKSGVIYRCKECARISANARNKEKRELRIKEAPIEQKIEMSIALKKQIKREQARIKHSQFWEEIKTSRHKYAA